MGFLEFAWIITPKLLSGLVMTLKLSIVALAGGVVFGLLTALARVYGNKVLYFISTIYVEVVRGTPVLVQLFIVYFGLQDVGIRFSPFVAASLVLILNSAAFQAEYFRGAIQTVKEGQIEAGLAFGMTKFQSIRYIVLPQMVRAVLPAWSNEFIQLLKFTSLAYVVSVPELTTMARFIGSRYFRIVEPFLIAALLYFIVVSLFVFVMGRIEKRLKIPGLGYTIQ